MVFEETLEKLAIEGKQFIRTSTLKDGILRHTEIMTDDGNTRHLAEIGIGQVIQKTLQSAGWKSVAGGYFVNTAECAELPILKRLVRNAHGRTVAAELTEDTIRGYEARQLAIAGIDCDELVEEPAWEDLIVELEQHAV